MAAPATRATLDRMVRRGLISRERRGREIRFTLTSEGSAVLREATERVRGPHPFEPHGTGWTLVTFSVPENQRTLRHRLRSALTWEGFAPLRDGLWLAPGEVDLKSALEPLQADLPPGAVTAFHARELPGYAMADNVRAAWDIDRIRDEHLAFIETWSDPATVAEAGHGAGRADDARRGLAGAPPGGPAPSTRLHERRLAGRSLVRGLLGRSASPRGARRRAVRGARRHQPAKRARRSAFRTFPDAVRGSSSTMTTFLGSL